MSLSVKDMPSSPDEDARTRLHLAMLQASRKRISVEKGNAMFGLHPPLQNFEGDARRQLAWQIHEYAEVVMRDILKQPKASSIEGDAGKLADSLAAAIERYSPGGTQVMEPSFQFPARNNPFAENAVGQALKKRRWYMHAHLPRSSMQWLMLTAIAVLTVALAYAVIDTVLAQFR